jgi:hypothetical protein
MSRLHFLTRLTIARDFIQTVVFDPTRTKPMMLDPLEILPPLYSFEELLPPVPLDDADMDHHRQLSDAVIESLDVLHRFHSELLQREKAAAHEARRQLLMADDAPSM